MDPIRTILVDDNAVYRASLATLLAQWPAVEVIAQAATGAEALELSAQFQPDLLLVDLVMPKLNGLELTRRLKAISNPPRVIVLTLHTVAGYRAAALAAGADACFAKDEVTTALAPAIQRLFSA